MGFCHRRTKMNVTCRICRWIRRRWWHFWKMSHQFNAMMSRLGFPVELIERWVILQFFFKSIWSNAVHFASFFVLSIFRFVFFFHSHYLPFFTYFSFWKISDAMGLLDRKFNNRSIGSHYMWFRRNTSTRKWFRCGDIGTS